MAGMKSDAAVEALSALAYEGRLSIFRLLVRAGSEGVAAGEVARKLKIAPSTLSASLSVLSNAGLVNSRREGRSIIYVADYTQMRKLLEYLMDNCCNGDPSICGPLTDISNRAACCA